MVHVLEALTPKACQEDTSYERLELLGDAFLKYAVSLFLFHKFPEAHEGGILLQSVQCFAHVSCNKHAAYLKTCFKRSCKIRLLGCATSSNSSCSVLSVSWVPRPLEGRKPITLPVVMA